jgi:hypothetical protein
MASWNVVVTGAFRLDFGPNNRRPESNWDSNAVGSQAVPHPSWRRQYQMRRCYPQLVGSSATAGIRTQISGTYRNRHSLAEFA